MSYSLSMSINSRRRLDPLSPRGGLPDSFYHTDRRTLFSAFWPRAAQRGMLRELYPLAVGTDNCGASLGIAPQLAGRFRHGAPGSAADEQCVLGERTGARVRLRGLPVRAPAAQLGSTQVHAQLAFSRIDADPVAASYEADRPANAGLGRDMPHDKTMTPPGATPVRNQCDPPDEAAACEGAGGAEHLAHARTPARALLAHDDDGARAHPAREDRLRRPFLTLKHARRALEAFPFLPGDLRHGALRREVPVEEGERYE